MYAHTGIGMIIVAVKVLATVVLLLCLIKNMTLESIKESVFSLSNRLCVAPVAF